jgi:hypothetical protein
VSADELPSRTADRASKRQWLGFGALFGTIGTLGIVAGLFLLTPLLACACTPVSQTPDVGSPAEGIVIAVDSSGLTDVRGFTLRTSDGQSFAFVLGTLENATEFPPGHLAEHQATSQPVRVSFRTEDGERVVYRLEDASGAGAT